MGPVRGVVAQLVERCVRNAEVRGSNPLDSTSFHPSGQCRSRALGGRSTERSGSGTGAPAFAKVVGVKSRYYTPEMANRSLPLVNRIAADVREVAEELYELRPRLEASPNDEAIQHRFEDLYARFKGLVDELAELGIELKNPLSGLLDFRAQREGDEVYLCWQLGEDSVGHWHELDAGFAGRQPISDF